MTMSDNAGTVGGTLDKAALRRKYIDERDKRLRADGNEQYLQLKGQLAHYLEDPYTPLTPRAPRTDHVTFAFIGGGFAGLVTAARLVEAGIRDVRIVEKGGDFGGTWYWNRYPGAQCDTASMVYMPLLEETGHMPSEKYARGPEILAHCQRIGRQYGLYEQALFHTEVQDLAWDDERAVWLIRTDRGDAFTAQFIGLGTGPLHVPKLPGIAGIESFKGHSFHTSRWDYGYTGGDRFGAPMTRLADQRVAIIGTGATAVQCVPHLARDSGALWVFQRTPSSVDVRANAPIDPAWFASIATPGMAAALARELHRQPGGRHGAGGSGAGRLDRPVAPHPRAGHAPAARADDAAEHAGRLRGLRQRKDGGDPRPRRRHRRKTATPRRSSRPGIASCASARASTTSTCRPSTRRTRRSSTPTARVSSASPSAVSWWRARSTRSTASSMPRGSRWAPSTSAAPASTSRAAAG